MAMIEPREHISDDERDEQIAAGMAQEGIVHCPSCGAWVDAGVLDDTKPCHVCGGGGCPACLTERCEGCAKQMHVGCVDTDALPNEVGEIGNWCRWCAEHRRRDLDGARDEREI